MHLEPPVLRQLFFEQLTAARAALNIDTPFDRLIGPASLEYAEEGTSSPSSDVIESGTEEGEDDSLDDSFSDFADSGILSGDQA